MRSPVTPLRARGSAGDLRERTSGRPPPRDAIDAAWTFARGGERGKTLRDTAWAALSAARDANTAAAGDAARAAMCAASAAYPSAGNAHQVKHIWGSGPRGEGGRTCDER